MVSLDTILKNMPISSKPKKSDRKNQHPPTLTRFTAVLVITPRIQAKNKLTIREKKTECGRSEIEATIVNILQKVIVDE